MLHSPSGLTLGYTLSRGVSSGEVYLLSIHHQIMVSLSSTSIFLDNGLIIHSIFSRGISSGKTTRLVSAQQSAVFPQSGAA